MTNLRGLSSLIAVALASAHLARAQANPSVGLVLTPATFAVLNPSIFGDNGAVVVGGNYGNRPDPKTYLFAASLSHVRFQFGRTILPRPTPVKALMTSLDYAHQLWSGQINPHLEVVSGVQGSVGYGLVNFMDGLGTEGTIAGLVFATGIRLSRPEFRLTPYVSPAYFFARESDVGFTCTQPKYCASNGFRFSFGGGLRLDLLQRLSLEGGIRKTQTPHAISRRSFGVSYRFGNLDGHGLRDAGSFTLQMDNDFFGRTSKLLDEDYTQGFHFIFNRRESPAVLRNALERLAGCAAAEDCVVGSSTLAGQEIYTPQYYPSIAADDRPFGGWLYGGMQSRAVTERDLTSLSVKIGVTGPPSLAEQLQVTFHELVPAYMIPPGWNNQLKFEPGVIVTAMKSNYSALRTGQASFGLIRSGSASVGNILMDLEAGLALRAGINAEHPWMLEKQHRLGVHASLGARGDIVLRNLFLDGNTFRASPHVKRIPLVWQKEVGMGISLGPISLDYQITTRSKEFTTGRRYHPYGTVSLTRRGQF